MSFNSNNRSDPSTMLQYAPYLRGVPRAHTPRLLLLLSSAAHRQGVHGVVVVSVRGVGGGH